jgi:hypothetical protein
MFTEAFPNIELIYPIIHHANVYRNTNRAIILNFTLSKLTLSSFMAAWRLYLTAS